MNLIAHQLDLFDCVRAYFSWFRKVSAVFVNRRFADVQYA